MLSYSHTSHISTVTFVLSLVLQIVSSVSSTSFSFETLTLTTLKLIGDAHLNNGTVSLTRDLPVPTSGAGRAIYSQPIQFRHPGDRSLASFSTFFSFSISNLNPSSIGGGLAFVISPDGESIGSPGGCLGLCSASGVASSYVAVEFDTQMDVEYMDINGNHVGLDLNSVFSADVYDLSAIEIDLKSGDLVNAWIEYDGPAKKLAVSVTYSNAKPKYPILSLSVDLGKYINDFMYVGFSGSTQGSTEIHTIEWWSFTSSFTDPPSPAPAPPPTGSSHPLSKLSSCRNQLCRQGAGAVAGVVTAGAAFIILSGVLVWFFSTMHRRERNAYCFASDLIKIPKEFTYKEMRKTTKRFNANREIGQGAFGVVYRGVLPETGEVVAVKRCKCVDNRYGKTEFLSEFAVIGSLRHRNLVKLLGWCHEKGEVLLVYDFMANGSLDKALHEATSPLPWPERVKILLGVAAALCYLHQECEFQVIHRDIKTSNIMLDECFNAKVGDFGLARLIKHDTCSDASAPAGTMGYLAPEYILTGRATEKTDVFSYGAVALEVASGRRPIDSSCSLVEDIWRLHGEGKILEGADSKLDRAFDEKEMRKVMLVGLACSHPDPAARPTMRAVVQMLVGESELPPVPTRKPTLSFSTVQLLCSLQESLSDCVDGTAVSSSSSVCGGVHNPIV